MVAKVGPHLSVVMDKVALDKVVIRELVMEKVVIGELVMEFSNDQGSIWRSGGRSWRGGRRGRVGWWTFKNLQSSDSFLLLMLVSIMMMVMASMVMITLVFASRPASSSGPPLRSAGPPRSVNLSLVRWFA